MGDRPDCACGICFSAQGRHCVTIIKKSYYNSSLKCPASAYLGLDFTHTANETEIVAYVSPGKPRFFTLPADLFFGVADIYIEVSRNGSTELLFRMYRT